MIPNQTPLLNTSPSKLPKPSDAATTTTHDAAETSDLFQTADDPTAATLFSDTPETYGDLIAEVFIISEPIRIPAPATPRLDSADIPTATPNACTTEESEMRRTHPPLPFYFSLPSNPPSLTRRSVLKELRRCNMPIPATLDSASEELQSSPKHSEPRLNPGG